MSKDKQFHMTAKQAEDDIFDAFANERKQSDNLDSLINTNQWW